jgi:parallel beta-helix repeat protein
MKLESHHHTIFSSLLTIAILLTLLAAGSSHSVEPAAAASNVNGVPCPSPTVKKGGQCVLTKDETLEKTLELASNTKLNCQNHKLTPKTGGSGLSQRSQPEVAIFFNAAKNVQIQNCTIDGFDFGIFAIKSKVSRTRQDELGRLQNKILDNTINARFTAVSLVSVDNTEVKNNTIKYTTAGGKGLYVGRDSDLNKIEGNTITADISPAAPKEAVTAPGPVNTSSNPSSVAGQAVLITQTLAAEPTLLNAIINGKLYQLTVKDSPSADHDFTEDNTFEGNTITFTQDAFDGIVLSIAARTIVRNNTVRQAAVALRAGIQTGPNGLPKIFPGTCKSDPKRACLSNIDCNILGTSGDTCDSPKPRSVPVFWVSDSNTIENNNFIGPFNTGVVLAGTNTVVRGNTITGPLRRADQGAALTLLGKYPLETTTFTRNVISDVATVFRLTKEFSNIKASSFGARISLNDFTSYSIAVSSDIPSTLSVDGRGNYWGLPCPQGFDPAKVQKIGLGVGDLVTDDHPYGTSVAKGPDGSLPAPCR